MNATRKRSDRVYRQTVNQVGDRLPHMRTPPGVYGIRNGNLAEANLGTGQVGMSRRIRKDLASKDPDRRKLAQTAIVHELAHLRQQGAALERPWVAEQGAEAFARRVGKLEFGMTADNFRGQGNMNAVNKARKRTLEWVMKDQFR